MEFFFTLFDHAADGLAGWRLARHARSLVAVVALGVALKLGAAEWTFGRYVEYRTAIVHDLLDDPVDRLGPPTTAPPASAMESGGPSANG